MLCDDLQGWYERREGRLKREEICRIMADSRILWQKPTQHWKTVFLQLKKRGEERNLEEEERGTGKKRIRRIFMCSLF